MEPVLEVHAAVESDTTPQPVAVIFAPPVAATPSPFCPRATMQPLGVVVTVEMTLAVAIADCDPAVSPASPIPWTPEKKSERGVCAVAV